MADPGGDPRVPRIIPFSLYSYVALVQLLAISFCSYLNDCIPLLFGVSTAKTVFEVNL